MRTMPSRAEDPPPAQEQPALVASVAPQAHPWEQRTSSEATPENFPVGGAKRRTASPANSSIAGSLDTRAAGRGPEEGAEEAQPDAPRGAGSIGQEQLAEAMSLLGPLFQIVLAPHSGATAQAEEAQTRAQAMAAAAAADTAAQEGAMSSYFNNITLALHLASVIERLALSGALSGVPDMR